MNEWHCLLAHGMHTLKTNSLNDCWYSYIILYITTTTKKQKQNRSYFLQVLQVIIKCFYMLCILRIYLMGNEEGMTLVQKINARWEWMAPKEKIVKILSMNAVRFCMWGTWWVLIITFFFSRMCGCNYSCQEGQEPRLDDSRSTHQWSTAKWTTS